MELVVAAFAAGILTVLAPCILPLLPVVLGVSIVKDDPKADRISSLKPLIITLSLGVSIIAFTLLLKVSSSLLNVPQEFWSIVSGGIIIVLGLTMILPRAWEEIAAKANVGVKAQRLLGKSSSLNGHSKSIATGVALGPVFNSCSPTYLFIVASILPATFSKGLGLLLVYTIGLCGTLLLIAYAGQSATAKLSKLSNPSGNFKKIIGFILVLVGFAIVLGYDKDIQAYVLEKGWYDPISRIEMSLE